MNELIKYFNNKYSKTHDKIAYPRTTLQIYQVYQIIKSFGIEDEKLNKLLDEAILPKPKTTEEKEAYAECIYESVNIPASRKYVDGNFPKKTSIEDNKLYLLKENGEKIDEGTELPSTDVSKEYVDTSLKNKVDKVTGKGLSTVDFTKSYETKLKGLENYNDTKVKEDIKTINTQLGDIANDLGKNEDGTDIELPTTDKTVKGAIKELFQNVSNGKTLVANAITDKGVDTLATDTFQTMATNIGKISSGSSVTYSITNNLSHATNNNSNTTVEKYNSYSANITVETGYKLDSVTVTMGGVDITSSCYSNRNISIEHVTGNIVITVTTSLIPPNTYSVTNKLTQCTSNNTSVTVMEGQSYTATITANSGYTINSIVVKMGNIDISSSVVSKNIITIAKVTGNIVITAIALENPQYSFGVMSDIHIPTDETTDNVYGIKYKGITKFTNVVNKLKDSDLDFVCATGDLTTYGYDVQYQNFVNVLKNLNKPFYSPNGNHDMIYNGDANNTKWTNYFGHGMNHVFTKNNDVFIFVSMKLNGTTKNPYDSSIDWLETQLNNYKNKRVFLFIHYPLYGSAGLKPNQYYGWVEASTENDRLLNLLKQHLNVYCFSGHTHYIFEVQEKYPNINVSTLDYYYTTFIHVPSLTQPRDDAGNMTDVSDSNQYLQIWKVNVYADKIVLNAINLANDKTLYTYEIDTNADYSRTNRLTVSTFNVSLNEGSTSDAITIGLEKAPSENITINIASNNQYVTPSKTSITFTPTNYSNTFTVSAVDDGTTADYTCLIEVTSDAVPSLDINIAVTNTTPITPEPPKSQGYDFSPFNAKLTKKFIPDEGYPYVYLTNSEAICSKIKLYTSEALTNGTARNCWFIGGIWKKYKWDSTAGSWVFYKDYDSTSKRYYPIATVSACSVDIEKATYDSASLKANPTGEIVLQANISLS